MSQIKLPGPAAEVQKLTQHLVQEMANDIFAHRRVRPLLDSFTMRFPHELNVRLETACSRHHLTKTEVICAALERLLPMLLAADPAVVGETRRKTGPPRTTRPYRRTKSGH